MQQRRRDVVFRGQFLQRQLRIGKVLEDIAVELFKEVDAVVVAVRPVFRIDEIGRIKQLEKQCLQQ